MSDSLLFYSVRYRGESGHADRRPWFAGRKAFAVLQRVASDLELRRQSQKIDVDRAISVALRGLVQQAQKQTGGCHILPEI
jgi:hypothetical protein